jgi:hypothetical protein
VCLAIDFGHTLASRPQEAAPTSYRTGRQHPAHFDGRHDLTAPVAVDSVSAAVGGRLLRQRAVLERSIGRPAKPAIDLARSEPVRYLRELSAVGEWTELVASPGLGDFCWLETCRGEPAAAASMVAESEVAR